GGNGPVGIGADRVDGAVLAPAHHHRGQRRVLGTGVLRDQQRSLRATDGYWAGTCGRAWEVAPFSEARAEFEHKRLSGARRIPVADGVARAIIAYKRPDAGF